MSIVRDEASTSRPIHRMTASVDLPGSAANVAVAVRPVCTRTASRSNTCAWSHNIDRSPIRNRVFDGSAS